MPLAMIHLTYLSELCFKNDFMVFMIYIRIENIRFEPKNGSYLRFLFNESADVLIDIQNHKSWPHIWNPIPYIMSIRTLKYTKDTYLFLILRESQIFHSFKSRPSTFSSVSKCLLT